MNTTITPATEANLSEAISKAKAQPKVFRTKEQNLAKGMKVKNYFHGWIGQEEAIRELNEIITCVRETGMNFPWKPLFLEGSAGLGKTRLARFIGKALAEAVGARWLEIPATVTLPDLIQYYTKIINNPEDNSPIVIFWDECAQLVRNKKVANALKPILETEDEVRDIPMGLGSVTSDPFKHFHIFASNEEPKDPALFGRTSRTEPVKLQPYNAKDKKALIVQMASEFKHPFTIHLDAIEYLEDRVFSNGRSIDGLTKELGRKALITGGNISLQAAKEVCLASKRWPGGMTGEDLEILNFLSLNPAGWQVGEIANKLNLPTGTVGDMLRLISGQGYIETRNGKKALTGLGSDYLKRITEMAKAAKAAKLAQKTKEANKDAKAKPTPDAKATPAKDESAKPAKTAK